MAWTYDNALRRINELNRTAPEVNVETFAEQYLPRVRIINESRRSRGLGTSAPLFGLSRSEAVVVDGVHVYVNLLDFDAALTDNLRETENAHARALRFLHFHYSACDRAVEDAGAQRVDFHGARLHAVVIEPANDEAERIRRALELAERVRTVAADAAEELGGGLSSRYRIGIDSGVCVAINSGRGSEQEPLFLGNAANFAAKLAEGGQEGVFVSDRVRQLLLNLGQPANLSESLSRRGARSFDATNVARSLGRSQALEASSRILEAWRSDVLANRATKSAGITFLFHRHKLPLKSIDYSALSASNSVRMPMATIFADIDGYTAYISAATRDIRQAAQAVRNLHVIRGELAAVVRDDFSGRKVRFIGDCIHAMLAEGTATETNEADTVTASIHLAGALRSSFNLTKQIMPGIQNLGLAIGIDLGPTPVSRIGVRGDRSVRVSVSKSSIEAEERQSYSDGVSTAIGDRAYAASNAAARSYFRSQTVEHMTYDVAVASVPFSAVPSTLETEEPRAHGE